MIVTHGGRFGGYGFYLLNNKPVFTWNMLGLERIKWAGKEVATIKMPKTIPLTLQWDENFDVGADTLTGVDDKDYQPPFKFTGELTKLTLTINRPKLTPADIKQLQKAMHKNSASE